MRFSLDPQYGMGLGDFFRSFAGEEARRMGNHWMAPRGHRRGRRVEKFTG
jgi:hypothetical protein